MQAFRIAYTSVRWRPRDVDSSVEGREGEVRSQSRREDGSGPCCEVRRGEGLCDVKSLHQITSECDQSLDLEWGRHRFRDDGCVEAMSQLNDAAHNGLVMAALAETVYERSIQFHEVDGTRSQTCQRRRAGAEVVETQADSPTAKTPKCASRPTVVSRSR